MRGCAAGAVVVALAPACSEPAEPSNEPPRPCAIDYDCGPGRYCTESAICRRDCYVDQHCFGPARRAQCNAQGRCVEPVDPTPPPGDDAASSGDALDDASDAPDPEAGEEDAPEGTPGA